MKLSGKFIKANDQVCDFEEFVPAPYFRKAFTLNFQPEMAEVTICGLGFYELYINGENITKGPLAPYISNTDDVCYYDNYNIAPLLKQGENVIGVLLGNGFRNPYGGGVWDFEKSHHRGPVTLAFCLEAEGEGQKFMLEADESFRTAPSPILYDDLRMGYCYDARQEICGWNEPGFNDGDWAFAKKEKTPRGILKLCEAEPIIVDREIKAVNITHYDKLPYAYQIGETPTKPYEQTVRENVYVYDFGINTAGVTKLHINGKPGQRITIRHGEQLIDGGFSINSTIFVFPKRMELTEKYLEYGQTDVFICKGGEETFVPKFKYDGFRYAYVEGLEESQVGLDTITLLEMHSDVKERAGFECSDEVLNKLQMFTRRSDLSNLFYFPTDCPHREKNGWTGDASASAEHMLLNLTVEKSLKEWLTSVRGAQRQDGALPGIIPTGGWGFHWGNGPAWDAVCVNLPYFIYKYTGDRTVIEENVSMIMRYLCYIYGKRDEKGLVAIGLGDWVAPVFPDGEKRTAPLVVTDSIMVYDIARKAAVLFATIGRKPESQYAQTIAEQMRSAVRDHLLDKENMLVEGNSQTSQAFALATGIFEEAELTQARKKLVEIIHRDGDVNACGKIGLRYLFHALSDMGESELAYQMIVSTHPNCYGYWIENGATSLWESFSVGHGADSKNHHFLGDISSWFIQELAGLKINPHMDDCSYFEVSPNFISVLSYAKAHYHTPLGKLEVFWERKGAEIRLWISVPSGMHGKVILKDAQIWKELHEGEFEIKI